MYGYWAKPEDFKGRNIVVVASSRIRAESPYFQKRVKGEDPITTLYAKKDGQKVARIFVRQLYDYRPRPFRKIERLIGAGRGVTSADTGRVIASVNQ